MSKLKSIFFSVFPKPRHAFRKTDVLPLVVFLLLFGALCIFLEAREYLFFARRSAFFLLIFTVWMWWMHIGGYSGLSRRRSVVSLIARLSLAGLFVILIAEPRAVRTSDVLSVVYAVDTSDSVGESTDESLKFVSETVQNKPPSDEAGLIIFGRNAAVELPPRKIFPFEGVLNSRIGRDATNLETSLSLAAAMLPAESRGRIVLVSDGTETAGNLSEILNELKARGISVDVLPIDYKYDDEVWVERLELPRHIKLGEPYRASVVLSSLKTGSGNLVLRENGEIIDEQKIDFTEGKNSYAFQNITVQQAGYYEYSATIEVADGKDHLRQNNTVLNYLFVEGEGKVLIVTDPAGDTRDWEKLEETIQEGERATEVISAYEFKSDTLQLMPYDCIVFCNVGADAFNSVQLQAMHNAVDDLGIGFLMVGGPNSFGPGGYHRTVIEDALPVSMDITKKKVLPKGALVIVLHTCEFPEGNTWGKRITKQAIKVLGAHDEVGVLVYGIGGEDWLFPLSSASEYEKFLPKINSASIGDMPSFASTMQKGLDGLKKSDAAAKHMIIISDGDPQPPPVELIKQFVDEQVSVSMVAIFPHGGAEISKMRSIADVTGGRYYFPSDPALLPSIFIKEAKTLKRSMIQNTPFVPESGPFPSTIMKGIRVAELGGYVLTTAKDRAEVVLVTPPKQGDIKDGEDPEIDPVLVTWKYGLGTAAAWTSDLSANWGKNFLATQTFRPFVKQLLTKVSRVNRKAHLRMWTYTSGNQGTIIIEDFHPEEAFLEVTAQVSGPRNRTETVQLKQIGPRRYQATVDLWGKGRYQAMSVGVSGDRTDRAHGGFIVPYSPEYLRFRSNPIVLKEIAKKTGGQFFEDGPPKADEIYLKNREPKKSSRPIFDWFLIALVCLIPIDVAVRRVQIDFYLIKSWFGLGKRKQQSTETMGALLQRKKAVASELDAHRKETPLPASARPTQPVGRRAVQRRGTASSPATTEAQSERSEEHQADAATTTGRLLALKRKRQTPDDE